MLRPSMQEMLAHLKRLTEYGIFHKGEWGGPHILKKLNKRLRKIHTFNTVRGVKKMWSFSTFRQFLTYDSSPYVYIFLIFPVLTFRERMPDQKFPKYRVVSIKRFERFEINCGTLLCLNPGRRPTNQPSPTWQQSVGSSEWSGAH